MRWLSDCHRWEWGLHVEVQVRPARGYSGGRLFAEFDVVIRQAEVTKATKKACAFCHVDAKAKPKELTAACKYYKEHKSLEGYKP